MSSCADPEGGGGGQGVQTPPPLKNHKNIGFLSNLSNTGPDPLENHKAAKPAFNVGPSSARQCSVAVFNLGLQQRGPTRPIQPKTGGHLEKKGPHINR